MTAPTVCIAHGAFIPCRRNGEHRTTSNPYWVKSVRDYQGSTIEGLTWEPAWEKDTSAHTVHEGGNIAAVLAGTDATANTWQSAARRLAERVKEAEANADAGWAEAMRQQQRVEKALLLAACWDREADTLGRSLSELMLRDGAKQLRAALAPEPGDAT